MRRRAERGTGQGTVLPDLQPRKVIGGQVGTGGVQDFIIVQYQPGAAGRKAAVISLDGAEIQHLGRQNGIRQSAVRVGKQVPVPRSAECEQVEQQLDIHVLPCPLFGKNMTRGLIIHDADIHGAAVKRFSFKEQRDFDTIDGVIAELEGKLSDLAKQIEANSADYEKVMALMAEQEQTQSALDTAMERWMYLQERYEEIQAVKEGKA